MQLTKNWIVGFVDGDGCFIIHKKGKHQFCVSQNKRSVDVLYALKSFFKCGTVSKAGGDMMQYQVSAKDQLKNIIIPFFNEHSLQTNKRRNDFEKLKASLFTHKFEIQSVSEERLSGDWLAGFIDADGSFTCSFVNNRFTTQLVLATVLEDKPLLEKIKIFVHCGSIWERNQNVVVLNKLSKKQERIIRTYSIFQVSSPLDFSRNIFPLLFTNDNSVKLRTSKRISLQKFQKIIALILQKQHLTLEGREKIKKLRQNLNPKKLTLISSDENIKGVL